MPAAPRNASPRTQRKRPGDKTGVVSQNLAAKRDQEKLDAGKEAVAAVAAEKDAKRHSVVDYSTGGKDEVALPQTEVEVGPADPEDSDEEVERRLTTAHVDAYGKGVETAGVVETSSQDDEIRQLRAQLAQLQAALTTPGAASQVDVDDDVEVKVGREMIRVNYPIENMTYGKKIEDPGKFDEELGVWTRAPRLGTLRNLNFEEGVKYIVDSDVAEHLRSLGYVYDF